MTFLHPESPNPNEYIECPLFDVEFESLAELDTGAPSRDRMDSFDLVPWMLLFPMFIIAPVRYSLAIVPQHVLWPPPDSIILEVLAR